MTLADAGRVLLVRTSAIGDIVHCLPVLTALRRQRPKAQIGWVVESVFAPLLDGHPDLDQVIPVPSKAWRKKPFAGETRRGLRALRSQLRAFRADVVLDLMGNHKAGVLARLSGCRRRIGLDRDSRREPSSAFWLSDTVPGRGLHAVDRALDVLQGLGLPGEPADFGGERLFAGSADPFAGEDAGELPDGPFALVHPSAGWGNKSYPPERWAAVARLLAAEGVAVRVAVGPGEQALVASIVRASNGAAQAVDAVGLPRLGHLSRRAAIVLGGDSGPVHLAHALGVSVLCLMGPTDPRASGPYEAPDRALWVELPCSFCSQRLTGPRACLLKLSAESVARHALRLLATSAPGTPAS